MANGWGGARAGAGRPRGSRDKRSVAVEDTLRRLKCDPIEGLAWLANNNREALGIGEDVPIALRAKAYSELAQYVAPKRKATEVSIDQAVDEKGDVTPTLRIIERLQAPAAPPRLPHLGD